MNLLMADPQKNLLTQLCRAGDLIKFKSLIRFRRSRLITKSLGYEEMTSVNRKTNIRRRAHWNKSSYVSYFLSFANKIVA